MDEFCYELRPYPMSSFFSRFFVTSEKPSDGFTQPQREALVDLLNFCTYADDKLSLAEDKVVASELEKCQWDPAVPLELFVSRSVTKVRNALESPARRASFLSDVGTRLGDAKLRNRALALCKSVFHADGSYSADEQGALVEIEKAFAGRS